MVYGLVFAVRVRARVREWVFIHCFFPSFLFFFKALARVQIWNVCVPSFPFVQFKYSVYGLTQTDRLTYTRVLQCSYASVGLTQARPNNSLLWFVYDNTTPEDTGRLDMLGSPESENKKREHKKKKHKQDKRKQCFSVSLISILHVSVQMHDCMIAYMAEVDTYNKGRNVDKVQEELFWYVNISIVWVDSRRLFINASAIYEHHYRRQGKEHCGWKVAVVQEKNFWWVYACDTTSFIVIEAS